MPEESTQDATAQSKAEEPKMVKSSDLINLLKSLEDKMTEDKDEEVQKAKEPEPIPEKTEVAKSMSQVIDEKGSDELKKTIDASPALKEFSKILGAQTDANWGHLATQINDQHAVNHALVKGQTLIHETMEAKYDALEKKIDGLLSKLNDVLDQPAASAKSHLTVNDTIEKSVQTNGTQAASNQDAATPEEQAVLLRSRMTEGLEMLGKSAYNAGDRELLREITDATVLFETSGQIDKKLAKKALQMTVED